MANIPLVIGQPQKVYTLDSLSYVRFRVIGNGQLFIGKTSGEVLSQTGTRIIASDGLVELHWSGELWAACDVNSPATVYFIEPDLAYAPPQQTESPGGAFRTNPPQWMDPKNQTFDYGVIRSSLCDRIKTLLTGKQSKDGLGRKLFHRE